MKEWFTASDLANMTDMPNSSWGVTKKARRENWQSRKRSGRGGGQEYHLTSLPPATQRALIAQQQPDILSEPQPQTETLNLPAQIPENAPQRALAAAGPSVTQLADWQRERLVARHTVLNEVDRLEVVLGREQAIRTICEMAQQRQLNAQLTRAIPIANAKSRSGNGKQTLSRRTLYRWLDDRAKGETALAPKARQESLPVWAGPLLALYQRPQKPSLAWCIRQMEKAGLAQIPSRGQAHRLLQKMSVLEREKGRQGPRELKNIRPFVRRDTSELWPTDVYIADGHTFDAEIAHPVHGKPFRPEITSILDVATRRLVGWSVDLAESGLAVLDALRLACCTGGIPAIFYTDRGSGYVNAMMTTESHSMLERLGITHKTSLPYNSQARGLVERPHETIWVQAARVLPTYMGKDMDPEAAKRVHKLTRKQLAQTGKSEILPGWSAFVRFADSQAAEYNNRPHRSLPMTTDQTNGKRRHETPLEAWARASADGWQAVMPEADLVDDLFRPYVARKTRRGEVNLFGNIYFSNDLADHHGEMVRVGYDIHDASRCWVRDRNERLICIAEFEANKRSYFPVSALDEAAAKRGAARLKRAQRKIDEIEQEQGGARPAIEHQPLSEETKALAAEMLRHLTAEDEPAAVVPITPAPAGQARPVFNNDLDWYLWAMDHPGQLTDSDRALLRELENDGALMLQVQLRQGGGDAP